MDKDNIYKRLQDIESQSDKLVNIIFALKTTDIIKYPMNYHELSTDAALRSERITCQLRNLVFADGVSSKTDYMLKVKEAHGIDIKSTNGILSICLPGLLPKRKVRINTAFLNEPLHYALQEYVKQHSLTLYENCIVCFSQVYRRSLPLCRVRDHDNLEFKQILDTISAFVLHDDSGIFCDSYHTTELGEEDHTVICVMGKEAFPEWLKNRGKYIDTISEIS